MRSTSPVLIFLVMSCLTSNMVFGATTLNKKKRSAAARKPAASLTAKKTSGTTARSRVAAAAVVNRSRVGGARLQVVNTVHTRRLVASTHIPVTHTSRLRARRTWSPWTEPTYADSTSGDFIDGEDLTVRRAAVDALGPFNGTVVVADPATGRILTMVNQKLALKGGFQPCSTVKLVAALAGLNEKVIERDTMVHLYGRTSMGLTQAIAHSNNAYFAAVGEKLGFEKVNYYARLFGLGEKAGLNIPGEEAGTLPEAEPSEGLGMMTSFGSGINLTPLQLAGLMSAIANGGTLYYLQYPRSQSDVEHFMPRVKRQLDIANWIPELKPGMMGAVEFGTARRANYDPAEPIMGKTGTCTDAKSPTHLGWFGSFNETGKTKLVVVVLLTGGSGVSGPVASGVAGGVYKNLSKVNYFQQDRGTTSPVALISTQSCCAIKTE
jgi:penicillin-binding protein 2